MDTDDYDDGVQVVGEGAPRLRSTVQSAGYGRGPKGRGVGQGEDRMTGAFEGLEHEGDDTAAQKSVDGWVLFVTGVHEEATNEDLKEHFSDCGKVLNLWMNLDRQTGYVKGYALVEYRSREEAQAAISELNQTLFLEQEIGVTWAFVKPPRGHPRRGGNRR